MLSRHWKREDALKYPTDKMFGKRLHERLAKIAVFLDRNHEPAHQDDDRNADVLAQIASAFDHAKLGITKVATPALWNIGHLLRDGHDIRGRPSKKLRKPAVNMYLESMQRRDLSVIFHLDPADYVADGIVDLPYYTRRPINEAFHVDGFYEYMRWATDPKLDDWHAAMAFHIVMTLADGVNELIDDVSEYCAVSMGANLDITRDDGQNRIRTWELISTRQKHVRDAAHEVWEMDKAFDAFRDTHGLVAEQLVQVVEKRRLEKPQPTYAAIEQELGVPSKEAGKLAQIIRDLKKDFARRPALLALMKEGNYGAKDRPSTSFKAGSE